MPKFRKKPVVIEAQQYTATGPYPSGLCRCRDSNLSHVHTLEGLMIANLRDWIIRGVKGEYYPCKPDIFEATYEMVTE